MDAEFFTDTQGRQIKLEYDGVGEIRAYHDDVRIGHFSWDERSVGLTPAGDDRYVALLMHIFLTDQPGYTHCGIGTEIVKMIKEYTGYPVAVCRDHGTARDDGAHPTGNASNFYRALVNHKLAIWYD